MKWSEEDKALVRQHWPTRMTAEEIGGLCSPKRNKCMVIGIAGRMGLGDKPFVASNAPANRPKPGQNKAFQVKRTAPADRVAKEPRKPPSLPQRIEEPGSATILTIGAHMCKWPIGDPSTDEFTFCGRRTTDRRYCPEHSRVARDDSPKPSRNAQEKSRVYSRSRL